MAEQFQLSGEGNKANPEYEQRMMEAGEQAVKNGNTKFDENGNINKPSNFTSDNQVPDKFINKENGQVDIEALLKSYKELETKFSGKETIKQEEVKTEVKQEETKQEEFKPEEYTVDKAKELATEKGIDFDKISQEFAKNNKLSDETYKHLEEKGIDKNTVNMYIKGQEALTEKFVGEILQSVGGKENYNEVLNWAKYNLSDVDKDSYQRALNTNDKGVMELAVQGLNNKYIKANGKTPNLVTGKTPTVNTSGLQPFKNQQDYINAMKDKRYKTDSSYRDEIYQKLNMSNI